MKVTDKVISFFPDQLPAEVSPYLKELEIRHLLTMSSGHDVDPTALVRQKGNEKADWAKLFLSAPLVHKPGTYFVYNSLGTYMLSAIIQKVTGEKVINYLYPRLFRPLGIVGATWEESPQGINCGGWGLDLKTDSSYLKAGKIYFHIKLISACISPIFAVMAITASCSGNIIMYCPLAPSARTALWRQRHIW